jgi:hypothetical protein
MFIMLAIVIPNNMAVSLVNSCFLACCVENQIVSFEFSEAEFIHDCHTRFWKANRMRTMYVPGSELTYTAIT